MKSLYPSIFEANIFEPFQIKPLFNDSFFNQLVWSDPHNSQESSNLKETDNQIQLSVDLPGFKKEDIAIEYSKEYLTISANSSDEKSNRQSIKKSVRVPAIELKKSSATLENGVLTLILEKHESDKKQSLKIS